jgi:heptosyltransferase-2
VNILLVRPDGIGDEILSLPVATALRRELPDARVLFLSSDYAAPLLLHHPDVDEVLTVRGTETLSELVSLFRSGRAPAASVAAMSWRSRVQIDVAIFLKPFRRLVSAAFLARVPVRVGTGYRWYSWLFNRRVYEHRSDFSKHESVYNLGLLRELGLKSGELAPPRLTLTSEERAWAMAFLGPSTARIVVHPGGFSSRLWKPGHFRDLVCRLAQEGCEVLLTGSLSEGERFRAETGMTEWPKSVRDLMGALSLRELMAVVAASHAVVSLASGPMHLAAALGVPTISLFDPRRNNSPARWRPLGKGTILMPDVPTCEKCIYEACPYWDCLDRITVETVCQRIQQVLSPADSASLAVVRV